MSKPQPRSYVPHPRFGDQPIASAHNFSEKQIKDAHWRYAGVSFFRETAIPADISKQKYATYPRSLYVDIERECESCGSWFLFFALEQKYWFEELGFWVDADCTRCIDCRKDQQAIRSMQVKYQQLVSLRDRTAEQTQALAAIAKELLQLGYIRDSGKLDL